MMTDAQIKLDGLKVLANALGEVEAEKFIDRGLDRQGTADRDRRPFEPIRTDHRVVPR